jgi:hypothetical protein
MKEEGRRKKEEVRGFEIWIQTLTQNERPVEVGVLDPQLK